MGHHYVVGQDRMVKRPNSIFVAPSTFCEKQVFKYYNIIDDFKILHSVDTRLPSKPLPTRVVIGDWRNNNKGQNIISKLRATNKFKFVDLCCGQYDKASAYSVASIYLTLSLSEGCSYSQLDALGCGLPVVSTNVSLFDGDCDDSCGISIDWSERENIDLIIDKLDYVFNNYELFDTVGWMNKYNSFENWGKQWNAIIELVS